MDNSLIRSHVAKSIDMISLDLVKGIIFDLDDTLYRSDIWVADLASQWFREVGLHELNEVSMEEIGKAFRDARSWLNDYAIVNGVRPRWTPAHEQWMEYAKVLLRSLGVTTELDSYAEDITRKWEDFVVPWKSTIIPGCKPVLEELHSRGYKLGLATNRWEDPSGFLQRDSVFDLFGAVEHSLVPGYKKPSPYMLFKIASRLNINPMRCVFIGDYLETDVEAARRAQMVPILLSWEKPDQAVQAPPGLIVIDEIRMLLDLFP